MEPTIITEMVGQLRLDSAAFLPELILCGAIVVLLLLRLFSAFDKLHMGWVAFGLTLVALVVGAYQWHGGVPGLPSPDDLAGPTHNQAVPLFGGLLIYDRLTIFLRLFLLAFALLIIWLSLLTGIPDREDSADFYCLLLGATLGMALMAEANHLLMVYLAVEMASLPSYALAGFLKGRRQSSEAALKYVVYGGGASGVMLYGISLLAGRFGTAYMPDLAVAYTNTLQHGLDPILLLATLFILVGIAFKLAAVPFHFWCPDVFEGAAAEVAAFLSVASKGAAITLLARFCLVFGGLDPLARSLDETANWSGLVNYLVPILTVFAALTATFGNLAAYLQTNLKRLLAYSTIAHAGFMLMALAPLTRDGISAMLFYLAAYLFMNLGAFAVVAFLRNQTGSEDLTDFRGLVRRSPCMVITLAICVLGLLGIPPLVGFTAKFQIFAVLYNGAVYYQEEMHLPGLSHMLIALLVIAGLNTVLSAVYYIKILKVMILDTRVEDVEGTEPPPLPEPFGAVVYASAVAVVVFGLGIVVTPLDNASRRGAERFLAGSPPAEFPVRTSLQNRKELR